MAFNIRPLDRSMGVAEFDCGEDALNCYVQRYATQDVRRGVTRVFVASPVEEPSRVAGFFSLSAGSISATSLPDALRKRLPRYPIPVALLGRMAVDKAFQGRGLGAVLLADVCQKVVRASEVLAVAGIVVDAKSAQAAAFYRHFGFLDLPGSSERLLLPYASFAKDIVP